MRDYSAAALKEGVSQETIGVYAQTRSLQRTSTLKLNTRYVKGKLVQKFLAKRATVSEKMDLLLHKQDKITLASSHAIHLIKNNIGASDKLVEEIIS